MGHKPLGWVLGAVAAALAGATIGAGPAIADVTVTPSQVGQGEAAKLTFHVAEDRAPAHTVKIELRLPASTPIAETYPMSVPDWAPRIATRTIDQPLGGIHHGRTNEVVSGITWTRAGKPAAGGAGAKLTVALGPMPRTDRLVFTIVQTYSDGVVTTWDQQPSADDPRPARPAPVLTLVAAPDPPPAGAAAGDGTGEAAPGNPADGQGEGGFGGLAVGLAVGLTGGLALGGWFIARGRRSAGPGEPVPAGSAAGTAPPHPTPAEPAPTDRTADPAGAAAPRRAWRLRE